MVKSLRDTIEQMAANVRTLTPEEKRIAAMEASIGASKAEVKNLKKDNERLVKRNVELSETLEVLANLSEQQKVAAIPMHAERKKGPHSAVAIVQWSDWHVAERVYKAKTNGLNAYNPDIAKARVKALTENTLKLIDLNRRSVVIDELLLVLGGDFITGFLHEELAQTNCMGVSEETYFAQSLLEQSVGSILNNAKMKRVRIVCHRGNHGRTTRKVQFKNDFETSWETLIYWNLRDRLSGDGAEWVIPESDVHYTTLQKGCDIRTIHGHQVKYQGGIGGISVPLTRWIVRQNQTHMAIATMLGHFHTFNPAAHYSICASLKGHDEYAQSLGFVYEPPSQLFMLFDCERKQLTTRNPIFCE
jgi:hypothetical protein